MHKFIEMHRFTHTQNFKINVSPYIHVKIMRSINVQYWEKQNKLCLIPFKSHSAFIMSKNWNDLIFKQKPDSSIMPEESYST